MPTPAQLALAKSGQRARKTYAVVRRIDALPAIGDHNIELIQAALDAHSETPDSPVAA